MKSLWGNVSLLRGYLRRFATPTFSGLPICNNLYIGKKKSQKKIFWDRRTSPYNPIRPPQQSRQ